MINASSSTVSENNGSQTDGQQTLINLGADLDLVTADGVDGSQMVEIILSGIPAGFTVPQTAPAGITMVVDSVAGTVTLQDTGTSTPAQVLAFLDTLQIVLPASMNDRDQNFTVGVQTSMTEIASGVTETRNGTHTVTINAVADVPTTDADAGTPSVQATRTINAIEGDGVAGILVNAGAALNDTDGSETLSVTVSGLPTLEGTLGFTPVGLAVVGARAPDGSYTLTGPAADINATLVTMRLFKDIDDSKDVSLTITSTATESNPTEVGEIAVPTGQSSATVTIAIAPRAEAPTLAPPAASRRRTNGRARPMTSRSPASSALRRPMAIMTRLKRCSSRSRPCRPARLCATAAERRSRSLVPVRMVRSGVAAFRARHKFDPPAGGFLGQRYAEGQWRVARYRSRGRRA